MREYHWMEIVQVKISDFDKGIAGLEDSIISCRDLIGKVCKHAAMLTEQHLPTCCSCCPDLKSISLYPDSETFFLCKCIHSILSEIVFAPDILPRPSWCWYCEGFSRAVPPHLNIISSFARFLIIIFGYTLGNMVTVSVHECLTRILAWMQS